MLDKQLRSLSKLQLLELLHQQELEIERLTAEAEETLTLRDSLALEQKSIDKKWEHLYAKKEEMANHFKERMMTLEKAGSIAEASLMLSGVMTSAQEAADLYLEMIKKLNAEKIENADKIEHEAKKKAEAIINGAEQECQKRIENAKKIEHEAKEKAEAILNEAERKCEEMKKSVKIFQAL